MEEERAGEAQAPGGQDAGQSGGQLGDIPSPEEQLGALKAELEESDREKSQYKDALLRAQADLANYKRRAEEERDEQLRFANSRLVLKLLPVLDDFRLALRHASSSDAGASWLEGVELIRRKLENLVESEAVSRIDVEGKDFDPSEHEALAYQESADHREGQVLSVVREGYRLHGRIIRPALVILAKKPQASTEGSGAGDEKETENG
jgi:molecular chaperone GrpE